MPVLKDGHVNVQGDEREPSDAGPAHGGRPEPGRHASVQNGAPGLRRKAVQALPEGRLGRHGPAAEPGEEGVGAALGDAREVGDAGRHQPDHAADDVGGPELGLGGGRKQGSHCRMAGLASRSPFTRARPPLELIFSSLYTILSMTTSLVSGRIRK